MMIKLKYGICFLLVIVILCALSFAEKPPEKWNGESDHKKWTNEIIFGNQSYASSKPDYISTKVRQLNDAVLLCVDQCNGWYQSKLEQLNNDFIEGIPASIDDINFNSNTDHRVYTHRGWNHQYAEFEVKVSHPDIRRNILRSVVNHVFKFSVNAESVERAYKLCDSMCCLLYCTHILGDRYHSKVYYRANSTLLLAEHSESLIKDLLEVLPVLFQDQSKNGDGKYKELIRKLQNISTKIIRDEKTDKPLEELLKIDSDYAAKIKDLLVQYIPELLEQQAWFTNAFDQKWTSR